MVGDLTNEEIPMKGIGFNFWIYRPSYCWTNDWIYQSCDRQLPKRRSHGWFRRTYSNIYERKYLQSWYSTQWFGNDFFLDILFQRFKDWLNIVYYFTAIFWWSKSNYYYIDESTTVIIDEAIFCVCSPFYIGIIFVCVLLSVNLLWENGLYKIFADNS
jgi:hypothetical protein